MDVFKTIGAGSAVVGVGVVGGLSGYWLEETFFSTRRNRTVIAVLLGVTSAIGTAYILKERKLLELF